jgi:hypothetical protein
MSERGPSIGPNPYLSLERRQTEGPTGSASSVEDCGKGSAASGSTAGETQGSRCLSTGIRRGAQRKTPKPREARTPVYTRPAELLPLAALDRGAARSTPPRCRGLASGSRARAKHSSFRSFANTRTESKGDLGRRKPKSLLKGAATRAGEARRGAFPSYCARGCRP